MSRKVHYHPGITQPPEPGLEAFRPCLTKIDPDKRLLTSDLDKITCRLCMARTYYQCPGCGDALYPDPKRSKKAGCASCEETYQLKACVRSFV